MPTRALFFPKIIDAGVDVAARVLSEGFAQYFVPVTFTAESLRTMARVDAVDLKASCLLVDDGDPVGAALVARRGATSRLAGMAIIPRARRGGLARALMEHVVQTARTRADRTIELEVIEQNDAAARLYESLGFTRVQPLVGHAGRIREATEAPAGPFELLEPTSIVEVARLVALAALPDLPWQLSAPTLAELDAPFVAFRQGPTAAVISTSPTITIRALVTERSAWRRGHALRLLQSIAARFPDREWQAWPIWPERLAPLFVRAGLRAMSLRQLHMMRRL